MLMERKESSGIISCENEYDRLERVLVCPPAFMKIEKAINETQKHFLDENINQEKAMEQHRNFIQALHTNGADVVQLPPINTFPEQVFTRDIGFTINDTVFISTMGTDVRTGEEVILEDWLNEMGMKHEKIHSSIEGGDVIVDGSTVWIGVSSRTTNEAIAELQSKLPDHKVIAVPFDSQYLHLDCLFNIVSPTEALIYSPAFDQETLEQFRAHYTLIEVNDKEQFTMGPNVLSLGNKTLLSLPVNKEINEKLTDAGYEVIELDISEIIKSGGSFRCCSLPIKRA
ncbi:dimethylarginine dimethylaminohydrolase family protein [Jeotgalibacillus sp. ET6]|uniref:dimethylarginine dimethylaminohydrolase family protein n=1 Tax=Jeotgalibacillus sp. ET6 TaxID=3037260 RepID=UPI003014BA2E